jgi:hypothetical protein
VANNSSTRISDGSSNPPRRPRSKEVTLNRTRKIHHASTLISKAVKAIAGPSHVPSTPNGRTPKSTNARQAIENWVTPETQLKVLEAAALLSMRADELITAAVNILRTSDVFRKNTGSGALLPPKRKP